MKNNINESSRKINSGVRLETILVPVDFSEHSTKALQYAIAFAEEFKAKLVLVSVVETPRPSYDIGEMAPTLLEWNKQLYKKTSEKLVVLAAESVPVTLSSACFTVSGEPTEEILAVAAEHQADLIVMGTHGRTGLKHAFLGSVAEKVTRHSPCPVLVVRLVQREFLRQTANTPETPGLDLHEIIVPLDFSDESSQALEWAEAIIEKTHARLNLLHVVPFHYGSGDYDALEFSLLEADMTETGRRRLAALAKTERERGTEVHPAVLRGLPRNEILEFTQQRNGDLVVMGTRGLTGIKHLLLGSTAEYVIRHAPCAILTVPCPKESPKRTKIAEPTVARV